MHSQGHWSYSSFRGVMIPIHHSLEVHPPHAPPPGLTAADSGQTRDQKPKTLPCKYCSKRFRLVDKTNAQRLYVTLLTLDCLGVLQACRTRSEA